MSLESTIGKYQERNVLFRHLGLKSKIPDGNRYSDLGVSRDPSKTMRKMGHTYGCVYHDLKDCGGLFFHFQGDDSIDSFITYKNFGGYETKLIAIHEETHALQFLRPDNLERLFFDKYGIKVDVINKEKFMSEAKINEKDLFGKEKKLYREEIFHEELVARIMTTAYCDKKGIYQRSNGALDDEAKRLYRIMQR